MKWKCQKWWLMWLRLLHGHAPTHIPHSTYRPINRIATKTAINNVSHMSDLRIEKSYPSSCALCPAICDRDHGALIGDRNAPVLEFTRVPVVSTKSNFSNIVTKSPKASEQFHPWRWKLKWCLVIKGLYSFALTRVVVPGGGVDKKQDQVTLIRSSQRRGQRCSPTGCTCSANEIELYLKET